MQKTAIWSAEGSSPRVRGADQRLAGQAPGEGIIPAHAGSSFWLGGVPDRGRDHPRACGEQVRSHSTNSGSEGSSPRMRGAVVLALVQRVAHGIIPAHAGSSGCSRRRSGRCWDHPRACGEQSMSVFIPSIRVGSSPRMRGAGRHQEHHRHPRGIIPAHTGSSS